MGDQIGQSVGGTLVYVPFTEFERLRAMACPSEARTTIFADMCRVNALYMIARAGSGHIGSSFSSMEIFSWMLLEELDLAAKPGERGDLFFSSKGHDAPGYYAALIGLGRLPFDLVHKLRRIDGLPGHPDVHTPGIVTNTGSLGMGVSKAKGLIFANRRMGRTGRVVVVTGDGELQEGQFWESLPSAVNHRLSELTVVIDHNKLQSDTFVKNVSDLGDLEGKLEAYGWCVGRCDGNDVGALAATFAAMRADPRPKVVIADTVKGKGVSFMEHTSLDSDVAMYRFHSGAPDADSYRRAAQEIVDRLNARLLAIGARPVAIESVERAPATPPPADAQRLIPAYTKALLSQAERHPELVALDADLILDTGLIPFREKFPERFLEFGIAEQDMVSAAGGMALGGLLPVAHSFSCFLSSRPNEQIYNNATEKTKVIYVGSLAGVVPGGPGHSHQGVRDISALGGIPGLVAVEPSCEEEVAPLLKWCVDEATGPCYIRLQSLPFALGWQVGRSRPGQGHVLRQGSGLAIISHGPAMLQQAMLAADVLAGSGRSITVINLPWLNRVDPIWLDTAISGCDTVLAVEDHYAVGGQADRVADALASLSRRVAFHRLALTDVPPGGTNAEVLARTGLDGAGIAARCAELVGEGIKR